MSGWGSFGSGLVAVSRTSRGCIPVPLAYGSPTTIIFVFTRYNICRDVSYVTADLRIYIRESTGNQLSLLRTDANAKTGDKKSQSPVFHFIHDKLIKTVLGEPLCCDRGPMRCLRIICDSYV